MSDRPTVSVIVPAHNAADTIVDCLHAIYAQRDATATEIIVIDDGSTDETARLAEAAGATIIRQARGRPAAARNAGIRAARGEIICCTDADCAPTPEWLARLTAPFADSSIAAAKGSYATRQREIVARFVQLEYEDKYDYMRGATTIDFIDTYAAAYRREVVLEDGLFDERFDYLEDQELSFRMADRGRRMVFQPEAVVYHRHAASLSAYTRKKLTIGYWKAQVVRLHPGRAVRDSHTPQVMKLQMMLAGLMTGAFLVAAAGLVVSVVNPSVVTTLMMMPALVALLGSGGVFLLTTLPFVAKAWRKDRAVALASPFLLFTRALALGLGYAYGVVRRP